MYTVRHLVAALSFIKDLNKNPNLNKLNLRPPHNYLPRGMTSLAHPLYRELPPNWLAPGEKAKGWERRRRARRERTEKSKRLKALKGLYNIHYQRVSLCEISLGSAFTRWTRPSLAAPPIPPPPPVDFSPPNPLPRPYTERPSSSRRFVLSLFRSIEHPSSLRVQSSHVIAPSSSVRGDGTESGRERRREEGPPL